MQRFEGGAQGEHKMARGLLPVDTHSAHWLAIPAFGERCRHLQREGAGIAPYVDELRERNPFKAGAPLSRPPPLLPCSASSWPRRR